MITPEQCDRLAYALEGAAAGEGVQTPTRVLARREDLRAAAYLIQDLVAELRTFADSVGAYFETDEIAELAERWRTP